jgi:hypothetical protein
MKKIAAINHIFVICFYEYPSINDITRVSGIFRVIHFIKLNTIVYHKAKEMFKILDNFQTTDGGEEAEHSDE